MDGFPEKMVKWSAIIVVVLVLVFVGLYCAQQKPIQQEMMSKSDEDYILTVLLAKSVDDCTLRPISDGVWSCTEFKSGKIFMVRR